MFLAKGGESYATRLVAEASQLWNSIFLAEQIKDEADIINILYPLADKLKYFGYRQFTDSFIRQLKKEMADVAYESKMDHDLDSINASKPYQTRMQKRIKHEYVE